MSRQPRIEFPGAFYHVFSRGNEKRDVFRARADYALFCALLKEGNERYHVWVHGFCLMPNHYHLILQTEEANLSRYMKRLLGAYTNKFNYRHKRVGHLFQGRYKAILVDSETYLLELSQYVHLNPCRAGLCQRPEEYEYSSMGNFLNGLRPSFLKTELILSRFPALADYHQFVLSGLGKKPELLEKVVGGVLLGSEKFVQKYKSVILKKQGQDTPKIHELKRLPVRRLKDLVQNEKKAIKYYAFWKWGNITQAQIAEEAGVTHSAVSVAIRRLERERYADPALDFKLKKIDGEMSNVED